MMFPDYNDTRNHKRSLRKIAGVALTFAFVIILSLTGSVAPTNAQGGGQPLPALPAQAVLDKIITETGGAQATMLGVPAVLTDQLVAMATTLNPALMQDVSNMSAEKFLDLKRAVYYISLDKGLKQMVVPLANNDTTGLGANITTPDGAPAQILGGSYDFATGPILLVIAWKDANAKKPSELRAYTMTNGQLQFTTPYKLNNRKFKGNKAGKVAPQDQGVFIAARETCFTLNTDQVCYSPAKPDKQADAKASSQVDAALKALSKTYDVKAKIDIDGALPEIEGVTARKTCAAKLAAATGAADVVNMPECAANMAFAGVSDNPPSAVVGAIWLAADIEQPAYDMQGNSVGKVAAGTYLIVNATPNITDPGAPGVLMLVNGDGKTHFLIPSQVVEGFGDSDDKASNGNKGQAAIKDARVGAFQF